MSQDNEKKPEELDFSDLGFDPFADSGVVAANNDTAAKESPAETQNAADSGFDLPPIAENPVASDTLPESVPSAEEVPVPSSFLTGDNDETPVVGTLTDSTALVVAAAEDSRGKKGKKKKEKVPKAKKEKKNPDGPQEPIGVGGIFCLVSGFLLLAILLIVDILMFVKPSWVFGEVSGVGSSSVLYYVIGITVIGLAGVVAVPFMFFASRKETDVFKIALGISVMALSTGVIFLMTEYVRYDFTTKAPAVSALSMPTGAPVAPANPNP